MAEPRIAALLFPLPLASVRMPHVPVNPDKRQSAELDRLKGEIKTLRAHSSGSQSVNSPAVKAAGKGKRKQQVPRMPKELIGMEFSIDGKNLCYSYNMTVGCSTRGVDRCEKGLHRCAFPGCGGDHSLQDCPKK